MTIRTDFEAWAKPWAFRLEQDGEDYANEHTDHAWMGFQAAHALYAPRWIPVSEGLPPEFALVAITGTDSGGRYGPCEAELMDGKFSDVSTGDRYEGVTHWQLMPSTEGLE